MFPWVFRQVAGENTQALTPSPLALPPIFLYNSGSLSRLVGCAVLLPQLVLARQLPY